MMTKIALGLLQVLGAVSLLAYPFVVFSLPFALGALKGPQLAFFLFLLVAPAIWIVLWISSWVLHVRRWVVLPFLLSALPAAGTLAGIIWYAEWKGAIRADRAQHREQARQDLEAVRAVNPVAAALMAQRDDRNAWPAARQAIEGADPALLSLPVDREGSPLKIALDVQRPDCQDAARLLLGRGAHLTPDEEIWWPDKVWRIDLLQRGITLPDPVAEQENPLVWRIVNAPSRPWSYDDQQPYLILARQRPELLNKETRGYGTPLHAALMQGYDSLADALVRQGAIMSEKERGMRGLAHQVDQFLAQPDHTGARETYAANVARQGEASRRSR